jgi:sterol desaturase/sphingolipid hydroxylase (fatty acid hydroxylase superfamily)
VSVIAPSLPSVAISRRVSSALLCLCILAAAALMLWPDLVGLAREMCVMSQLVDSSRCANGMNKLLGFVMVTAAFPAILLFERMWPARASQDRLSVGVLVDFFWFLFTPLFLIVLVLPVQDALRWVYSDILGLPELAVVQSLPVAVQILVVVLLGDFMGWLAHVVRHKSSFVWEFHKIHHAQEDLNYFTTDRIHPVDALVIMLVRFLPFTLLDTRIAVPALAFWIVFSRIYTCFTHSNIRTNMGPLKYILVTPQSHRIHHSNLPEHQDKNFANVFSIWDFIFGTQVLDFDVYPETGVKDEGVPRPAKPTIIDALKSYGAMLIYPFSCLLRKAS